MVNSLIRSVVDVAAVVTSVFTAAFEPIDVAVVDNVVSVAVVVTITLAVVVSTMSVPKLTVNFGAIELDVGCDGDVNSSVDAIAEEEEEVVVEEVDDVDDDDDDVGVVVDDDDDAISVTISSELCYRLIKCARVCM